MNGPVLVVSATALGAVVIAAVRFRGGYSREAPLAIWGRDYASAEQAARMLGEEIGLRPARVADGLAWVNAFFLAPIWFIWGDLRTRRPERHLARWRLEGARDGGRAVVIALGPEDSRVELACAAAGFAVALDRPFEQQEGLRPLHPVGGARWASGVGELEALARLGARRVRADGGRMVVEVPSATTRGEAPRYREALARGEALARVLESP